MNLLERLHWLEEHSSQSGDIEVLISISESNNDVGEPWPDERKAECPYCKKKLAKIPGSKTKCVFCSKYMYVRANPFSESRRVVTEEEVELIDDEWARRSGKWEERLLEQKRKAEVVGKLARDKETAPTSADIRRGIWEMELDDLAAKEDWWSYRCKTLDIAKSAKGVRNSMTALISFLDVFYFDANGATPGVYKWNVENAKYVLYIAESISQVAETVGLGEPDLLENYSERASFLKNNFNMPVDMLDAWLKFKSKTHFEI